jgi:hypothetical protein
MTGNKTQRRESAIHRRYFLPAPNHNITTGPLKSQMRAPVKGRPNRAQWVRNRIGGTLGKRPN